jgi:HPt (histidine-containing phosphotransfer) domain-containing protein
MTQAASETDPDRPAVLDAQALAGLTMLDPTGANRLVQRVLSTYNTSLARLLQQIDEGQQRADAAAVRLAAHTLKSSSASIGALDLSRLCAAAEQAIRDGNLDAVPSIVQGLQVEARRVALAVQAMLSA